MERTQSESWRIKLQAEAEKALRDKLGEWPEWNMTSPEGLPLAMHIGQELAWESTRRIVAILSGAQGGKALAIDTPIPTPRGFKRMEHIQVGDTVFDEIGTACKVVYTTEIAHRRKCYSILFDDYRSIVCDGDHLWPVCHYQGRRGRLHNEELLTTRQMLPAYKELIRKPVYRIRLPLLAEWPENSLLPPPFRGTRRSVETHREIMGIEEVDSVPVKCIEVDSDSHLYLAGQGFIPTHNTIFGPMWLFREIYGDGTDKFPGCGRGDYFAATATYDLFDLNMLPRTLDHFCRTMRVGKYRSGKRQIELRESALHKFMYRLVGDPVWAKIILRSAESEGGLESATIKAAWSDEAGQPNFKRSSADAVKSRLAIHRGRHLITTTLYNLGWVVQDILSRAEDGGVITDTVLDNGGEIRTIDNEKEDIFVVQFDSMVNPAFSVEEYEENKRTMPNDAFAMRYRGRVAKMRTMIFDCFDYQKHTIPAINIPNTWPVAVGVDPIGEQVAGIFGALDPSTGIVHIFKEYSEPFGITTRQHVMNLRGIASGYTVKRWQGGGPTEKQARLDWAAEGIPLQAPPISDVWVGIMVVYTMMKGSHLLIHRSCPGLIDEITRYQRKAGSDGQPTDQIANKAAFHRIDGLRYLLSAVGGPREVSRPIYRPIKIGLSY